MEEAFALKTDFVWHEYGTRKSSEHSCGSWRGAERDINRNSHMRSSHDGTLIDVILRADA
eukprot:397025-Amphidinium_carterae.1